MISQWERENKMNSVPIEAFAGLFKHAFEKYVPAELIVTGFKARGLYTFNSNSIDESMCLGKAPDTESQ